MTNLLAYPGLPLYSRSKKSNLIFVGSLGLLAVAVLTSATMKSVGLRTQLCYRRGEARYQDELIRSVSCVPPRATGSGL